MNAVFADTSYWIALANVQDEAHEIASAFSHSLKSCPILTTEPVLIEYLNYFADWGPHFRRAVALSVRAILASQTVRVVRHTDESFLAGLGLYSARSDKGYSLTDCISMQVMRRDGLTEALTNDRHFEQEGYRALFRST